MKQVLLQSLTMTSWRGERGRTTTFAPRETTISGANGLGKSRHFDAFTWLLFGKDTQGRKDFEIKSIVNGAPLERTDCEVIGVLSVDGETITLRRVYTENWVKPRGQAEQVLKGHETKCYWNDTPISVREYQSRISGIIDEELFKMITNPSYFASMPWKSQREQLFALAGTITDEEIAQGNQNLTKLLHHIGGKSFADFKAELSAQKRRLKTELDGIQPRIDQTERLMPEEIDFDEVNRQASKLSTELNSLERELTSISERSKAENERAEEIRRALYDLKAERAGAMTSARIRAGSQRSELASKQEDLERQLSKYTADLKDANQSLSINTQKVSVVDKQIQALRDEWYQVNASAYDGETTCQCCGQMLPDDKIHEAESLWRQNKQDRLAEINKRGKEITDSKKHFEEKLDAIRDDIRSLQESIDRVRDEAELTAKALEALPVETSIDTETQAEIARIDEQITLRQQELDALRSTDDTAHTDDILAQRQELVRELDECKAKLATREQIQRGQAEIDRLKREGGQLSQQIADIEMEEYYVQQFTIAKVEECERRVNMLFSSVTFKLFDYTIEDAHKENPIETCIPLVDGIPFPVANTAGQVNAGLDIINALCKFYGVTAPIFIDGRESVNTLIHSDSQIINLVVTTDKELIIMHQ